MGHWRILSILIFLGELLELFLFLGAAALATRSFFSFTADGLVLVRESPLFLGHTPASGSLNGSSLGKDSFLLGRLPLPAVPSRSLLTSSSLEKDFFFLGLGKGTGESSIPFS